MDKFQMSANQVVSEVKDSDQTFACEICGKLVPNDQMAKRLHMDRVHYEKLIKYTPGRVQSNKTHNNSIGCEMCEFTCQSKPSLKRHMATTHAIPVKRNLTRSYPKRKLPDKKEKCDICGRMFLNLKGIDIHKKRMHPVDVDNLKNPIPRSDSVKSPPPKKHEQDVKLIVNPRKVDKQEPEKTPPEESMDTQLDPEKYMEIEEDLRLARQEVGQLKRENELLRHINKTQTENHAKKGTHIGGENISAIKVFEVEYNKALKEIARLQKENQLLIAREEVITSVMDNEKDECILNIKCKGDCEHLVKEVIHRCTQCSNRFQNKTAMEQHMREVHKEHPNCPFCSVSFTSLNVLRQHIDETHAEITATNVEPVHTSASSSAAAQPTETLTLEPSREEVSSSPQEDELQGQDEQEDEQEQEDNWHEQGRHGGKFRCQTCGYTRNTKHQLERHVRERHEYTEEEPFLCRNCSYKGNNMDDLNNHIMQEHVTDNSMSPENNEDPQIITHEPHESNGDLPIHCDMCNKPFRTMRELSHHMSFDHKSYKPCHYFKEGKCDVDGECRYNHEILKPGQEICYKCGLKFKSKSDLLRHIEEKHGHEICHRYLQNKCTVRRCLFRHIMPNAPNVHRISQGGVTQVSTQANFRSLPTAGPVVWSQAVARGSEIPVMPRVSIEVQDEFKKTTAHIIESQLKEILPQFLAAVTAALNLTPQ